MPRDVPQLRSDARASRERILHAARDSFSEHGPGARTREIARHAGVGPTTLYRHFPSRQELIEAAFANEHAICEAIVQKAVALENPWDGIRLVIERALELNARNGGFVESTIAEGATSRQSAGRRDELLRVLATLVDRARRTGHLRSDFTLGDLTLVLAAGRGIQGQSGRDRVAATRRFAQLTLDALLVQRQPVDHRRPGR